MPAILISCTYTNILILYTRPLTISPERATQELTRPYLWNFFKLLGKRRWQRGAFHKTGIYPFNPKAVLDEVPLKEIEKGRLTPAEPTGNSSPATGIIPANITVTTPGPKQKARNPAAQHQPAETPHNTAAVQSHVIAVLDECSSGYCH